MSHATFPTEHPTSEGDKRWFLWVVLVGIAPDVSHPTQWKLEIILVPLGTLPLLWWRNFNETARYVDQGGGKRKGAFAMYLAPWQGNDHKSSNRIPWYSMICWFLLVDHSLVMQIHVFPKLGTVCPKLPASLQQVWGCSIFATFFLSNTFSQYHMI